MQNGSDKIKKTSQNRKPTTFLFGTAATDHIFVRTSGAVCTSWSVFCGTIASQELTIYHSSTT